MLGLIILYYIGKQFYELAENYDKSKWGFAILGVITYYVGALVFGAALGLILYTLGSNWLETANSFVLGLIELPIGGLSCYLLYYLLEKTWKKEVKPTIESIDNIGKS